MEKRLIQQFAYDLVDTEEPAELSRKVLGFLYAVGDLIEQRHGYKEESQFWRAVLLSFISHWADKEW